MLGSGAEVTVEELDELLRRNTRSAGSAIEGSFADAGWYGSQAEPYPPPTIPVGAPPVRTVRVLEVDRRLWLARFNPADPDFDVPDIADDIKFPWQHPEAAVAEGWWLSTTNTPRGRPALEEISTGDLVICQRSDPGAERDPADLYRDNMLVGICVVGMTDAWDDSYTGRRERKACMVPLAKFTYPVPRRTASRHGRLVGASFRAPRQLPGRGGPLGFGLSAVEWNDAVELLSVCGIAPDALTEPDNARLAARLQASDTGNRLFLGLRYDAVLQDRLRRVHERLAERHAEAWAAKRGYIKRAEYQHVPLAGFDLLFSDTAGRQIQVEVKGYATRSLASAHLQPSQATRARQASAGTPPPWWLFALLGAGTETPTERVATSSEVVQLLGSGGLKVRSP
jgi:hypothetical protein